MDKLENIGFSHWLRSRLDADKVAVHDITRVVSVHKDRYIVTDGLKEIFAELSASFFPRLQHEHPGLERLGEALLHRRREYTFLVFAGLFLGSLTMLAGVPALRSMAAPCSR